MGLLVELLRCPEARWFAAGALQSLTCRSEARKAAIVNAGALSLLFGLLACHLHADCMLSACSMHGMASLIRCAGASG